MAVEMGEWLGRIDATTTLEEVARRPSLFNPYPQLADGGVEVWTVHDSSDPLRTTVHYPEIDAYCRAVIPISDEVQPDDGKLPELLKGSDFKEGEQITAAGQGNWVPLADFWDDLSVTIAGNYLTKQGAEAGAKQKFGELLIANAMPRDHSDGRFELEPRALVRETIALVHQELAEGRPEVGYAIATKLFTGFIQEQDGQKVSNMDTMKWTTDGLAQLLFPHFVDSWRQELEPRQIMTAAHPYEIGITASHLITKTLSGMAIDNWLETQAAEHPAPIAEKVASLQRRTADDALVAAAKLETKLAEACIRFPEAIIDTQRNIVWRIPYPLGNFVMNVVSSAD